MMTAVGRTMLQYIRQCKVCHPQRTTNGVAFENFKWVDKLQLINRKLLHFDRISDIDLIVLS